MGWLPKKCVVVPFDFSEHAEQALESARIFGTDLTALHVVHVLPTIELAEPGVIWETIDDEARRRHAEGAFRERFANTDFKNVNFAVRFGDPAHEIAAFAEALARRINRHAVPRPHGLEPFSHRLGGGTRRAPRALPGVDSEMTVQRPPARRAAGVSLRVIRSTRQLTLAARLQCSLSRHQVIDERTDKVQEDDHDQPDDLVRSLQVRVLRNR